MRVAFEDCSFDLDRFELYRSGELVPIEPQAMRILVALIENRDRVVSKEELLDTVWGGRFVSESALTTQIKGLRKAVGDTGRDQRVIKTVHGQGYLFVAELTAGNGDGTNEADRSNPLVAVLPFDTLGGADNRSHMGHGLTHDLVTALSKHRWLRVVPRATAATFASAADPITGLRDELGVDYVIEGAVRLSGERLRVNASLTDTGENRCVWAERYDRTIDDLFDVLDELTSVIAATIEPEVGYAERAKVTRVARTDLAAWELYHLALAHFFRFTAEDNLEAQRLLARCRRLDPDFGDAHAWWAYAVVLGMVYWDTEPDSELLDEALAATQQALDIDNHNAVFHMLRGRVKLARREYAGALADNQRAINLNPTFAAAFCGLGDSLCYEGDYEQAIDQFSHAVKLGTHDPQRWAFLSYGALALIFAGRYDEALTWADRACSIPNCQYWTIAHRVVALAHLGRDEEAKRAVSNLLRHRPEFTVDYARRKLFYLKDEGQLERYLGGLSAAGVPER